MSFFKETQHLSIPFRDIVQATNKFTTLIGKGGYGNVYKGELSLSGKLTAVAVKRLEINLSGQGLKEFLTEIHLLSRYKHQNLVPLLGYCEEDDEKILIYEYADGGSLDKYLKAPNKLTLTWEQRINICIDAAQGLDYLHNRVAENLRVIHRDIKSANILLDRNLKAMIADFGLSKIGYANEYDTFLITDPSGTFGYCDPAYIDSGILTKESDVYSFGVVLFEILCGRLCFVNVNNDQRFLAPLAQRCYEETRLNEIIDPDLKEHMDSESLKKFSEIAYECLRDERKLRPSMGLVVQKLTEVLEMLKLEERKMQELEERRMQKLEEKRVAEERRKQELKKWTISTFPTVTHSPSVYQPFLRYGPAIAWEIGGFWDQAPNPMLDAFFYDPWRIVSFRSSLDIMREQVNEMTYNSMKKVYTKICECKGDEQKKVHDNSPIDDTLKKAYTRMCKGFYLGDDNEKRVWRKWLNPEIWNKYAAVERKMKKTRKNPKRRQQKRMKNKGKWKHF